MHAIGVGDLRNAVIMGIRLLVNDTIQEFNDSLKYCDTRLARWWWCLTGHRLWNAFWGWELCLFSSITHKYLDRWHARVVPLIMQQAKSVWTLFQLLFLSIRWPSGSWRVDGINKFRTHAVSIGPAPVDECSDSAKRTCLWVGRRSLDFVRDVSSSGVWGSWLSVAGCGIWLSTAMDALGAIGPWKDELDTGAMFTS